MSRQVRRHVGRRRAADVATEVGELHYRAVVTGLDNEVVGTMDADQHDAGAMANGVAIVLSTGGEISSHL
ncbi:hypothetical protein ACFYUY_07295 [Kitasatospora sp. NPDC004745]|uniref:hypothetical protein n=1 Tax=unclassified Kitasatospora TaxID=2633591 RepID=UPI0033C13DD7